MLDNEVDINFQLKQKREIVSKGHKTVTQIEKITAIDFVSPNLFLKAGYYLSYISGDGPFNIFASQCKKAIDLYLQKNNLNHSSLSLLNYIPFWNNDTREHNEAVRVEHLRIHPGN